MVHNRFAAAAILWLLAALAGCSSKSIDWSNAGAPVGAGFQNKQFEHDGNKQNYTVFVPHAYRPGQSYPVIVFLHGVLESGSDGRKCVTVGLGPTVNERATEFPFFAVFPQSSGDWQGEQRAGLAIATLDRVLKDYSGADPNRVFLTGLSNGGDGTWSIGASHTHRFAALVPMCGKADYDDASRLTKIPIWCFHNSVDPFRSAGNAAEMCKRIKDMGGNVTYTQYPEFGHDCWTRAYREGEIFKWLLQQRRGTAPMTAQRASLVP